MIKDIRNNFASKFEERIRQEAELQAQRLSDAEERRERERLRQARLNAEALQRKENDEWNPDTTDAQGLAANALKVKVSLPVNKGNVTVLSAVRFPTAKTY